MQMLNRYPEDSLTPVELPMDCRAHGVLAADGSTARTGLWLGARLCIYPMA